MTNRAADIINHLRSIREHFKSIFFGPIQGNILMQCHGLHVRGVYGVKKENVGVVSSTTVCLFVSGRVLNLVNPQF